MEKLVSLCCTDDLYQLTALHEYRIAGKFDEQNIWRFAPPKVLGDFKFGDGSLTVA